MEYKITLLPGDGIGPEVIGAAETTLHAVEKVFGHDFHIENHLIGGAALDETGGDPLPAESLAACKESNAILVGPVGGPKWDSLKPMHRPELGLLTLRKELKLYAGLFPMNIYDCLSDCSALRPETTKKGADIMLVREMTGGIYFGERGFRDDQKEAFDSMVYAISEVERVAKIAFELAMHRGKHVTSVDKENVLFSGKLWRATVATVAKNYPEVRLDNMLVSTCAARLMTDPSSFDVILTTNMFGDILCGTLGAVSGSIGILPSAAVGGDVAMYAPVHGTAPDIAGNDAANPVGAILSAALMLSTSLKLVDEAVAVQRAVRKVMSSGLRTGDIAGGKKAVSCSKMSEAIAAEIKRQ